MSKTFKEQNVVLRQPGEHNATRVSNMSSGQYALTPDAQVHKEANLYCIQAEAGCMLQMFCIASEAIVGSSVLKGNSPCYCFIFLLYFENIQFQLKER